MVDIKLVLEHELKSLTHEILNFIKHTNASKQQVVELLIKDYSTLLGSEEVSNKELKSAAEAVVSNFYRINNLQDSGMKQTNFMSN